MSLVTFIVGPTGSGKSAYALEYASQNAGTIINADSQQCYKDCPILTAQPTQSDFNKVPHIGYGTLAPDFQTSVGWWVKTYAPIIKETDNPIVVGGTGLYIDALLYGLSDIPILTEQTIARVNEAFERSDWREWAHSQDPMLPSNIVDPQRLKRAIGVLWQSGKSIVTFWSKRDFAIQNLTANVIVLRPEMDALLSRLEKRLQAMLTGGALDEVRPFCDQPEESWAGLRGILGFQEVMAYIKGNINKDALYSLVLLRTRQYAKRQNTWFRNRLRAQNNISICVK